MMQSMTGFGSKERQLDSFGKISIELRSSNHKFFEAVFHLPEGFLAIEERVKKEIESRIKRGRVTCAINIAGTSCANVFINKALLKNYINSLNSIKKEFDISDGLNINTLVHLPGIISLEETRIPTSRIWPHLKLLLKQALDELVKMRQKEGKALEGYLKNRTELLKKDLDFIKAHFKKAIKERTEQLKTDEERAAFLKDSDITEEIERLSFHIRNFKSKLSKSGPVGKELDFIAQEMQRETNTLGAKSFDVAISARGVQLKSQIEKIREQVQNIE